MTRLALLWSALWVLGCHDKTGNREDPAVESAMLQRDVLQLDSRLQQVGEGRLHQIARVDTCRPEDWPPLLLMAVNRYDWSDELAEWPNWIDALETTEQRYDRMVRSEARLRLVRNVNGVYADLFRHGRNLLIRRRLIAAFSAPEIVSVLGDAINGPDSDFAFEVLSTAAPLEELRAVIDAHASPSHRELLLKEIDLDRAYNPGTHVAQMEHWAAEMTPAAFERVLEAIEPGYVWGDGSPSKAERAALDQSAVDLLRWLGQLASSSSITDCGLRAAVLHGRLGRLVLARLDHPNSQVRLALLDLLAKSPPDGSLARVAKLQTDPDSEVRSAAANAMNVIEGSGGSDRRDSSDLEP